MCDLTSDQEIFPGENLVPMLENLELYGIRTLAKGVWIIEVGLYNDNYNIMG